MTTDMKPGKWFCMGLHPRYGFQCLDRDKREHKPQAMFSVDGKPLSYEDAFTYLHELEADGCLIPQARCDKMNEKNECQGHEKQPETAMP